MKPYKIKSTSRQSAECDPIILRVTSSTRLIFKPLMVDNPHSQYASIKGKFIFQKKGRNSNWVNIKHLNLSNLRAREWIKLEIKSEELLHLFKELYSLYKISHRDGIPFGETHYIKAEGNLKDLSKISENDLKIFFQLHKKSGSKLLSSLLNYAINVENPQQVIQTLEKLKITDLQKLNSLVGLSNLKRALEIWNKNSDNSDEEFWQTMFLENTFVLSQIFSFPIILIKGKAYVGGKSIENIGGNLVDFLCKNELTKNAVLIEIKTPTTRLLGSKYRNNVYNVSDDISGSVIQISNYRNSLALDLHSITAQSEHSLEAFNPHCVVIMGNIKQELEAETQRKSFELFRNSLREIQIITYDELFRKIENIVDLFEKANG